MSSLRQSISIEMRAFVHLSEFLRSMAGRIFLILTIGVILSGSIALAVADITQRMDYERVRIERVTARLSDIISLFDVASPAQRQALLNEGAIEFQPLHENKPRGELDDDLTQRLIARLGEQYAPSATHLAPEACKPPPQFQGLARPLSRGDTMAAFLPQPSCWLVGARLSDGTELQGLHAAPVAPSAYARAFNPSYLSLLCLAAIGLALFVARMAAAPLHDLAKAANALGDNIERAPLEERGPSEVRDAARAFNTMQTRLRDTLSERMRMLAAITHDLQTPITRMRLRLEKVDNHELRERLVADLHAMQNLIREGLDLAQSAAAAEELSIINLDSLLETLIADASDAGHAATLLSGCGADVLASPNALQRCLSNLVDNAIVHGGSVEIACDTSANGITICIRDHGPGIPEDQLEAVFSPFHRLESSRSRDTGGTGLGLTIARALAQRNNATLQLQNYAAGGLEVLLTLPASVVIKRHEG